MRLVRQRGGRCDDGFEMCVESDHHYLFPLSVIISPVFSKFACSLVAVR